MTTISNPFVYSRSISLADDAATTLPTIGSSIFGWIAIGTTPEYTKFSVDSSGTVVLIYNTDYVIANSDTDTFLCIGTATTQNPLIIKNRLGSTKTINIFILFK